MFDNKSQNLVTSPGEDGVYNQFVAPITTDNLRVKKDPVRTVLLIIFIVAILLAVGAVFFAKALESDIEMKKTQLNTYASSTNVILFESKLGDMRATSQRLKLLNDVYNSRQYIAGMFFPVLGSLVESTRTSYVYFNRVSLKKDNTTNLNKISLSGIALDYPTLYRQVNTFKFGKYSNIIHNFKLENFSMNQDMHVEFSMSFDIEINTEAYLKFLNPNAENSTELLNSSSTISSGPLFNKNNSSQVNTEVASSTATTSTTEIIDFNTASSTE